MMHACLRLILSVALFEAAMAVSSSRFKYNLEL
jgi:hypothetical protein